MGSKKMSVQEIFSLFVKGCVLVLQHDVSFPLTLVVCYVIKEFEKLRKKNLVWQTFYVAGCQNLRGRTTCFSLLKCLGKYLVSCVSQVTSADLRVRWSQAIQGMQLSIQRLAFENKRFPFSARWLAMRRGEFPAEITQLMFKCL